MGPGSILSAARWGTAAIAVFVAIVVSPRLSDDRELDWTRGYTRTVADLADAGKLVVETVPRQIAGPSRERVTFAPDSAAEAATLAEFRRRSFLGVDMLRADLRTWRRDTGQIVGINGLAHPLPRLRPAVDSWHGLVTYRGGERQSSLVLVPVSGGTRSIFLSGRGRCELDVQDGGDSCGGKSANVVAVPDTDPESVELRRLANRLLLVVPTRLKNLEVTIDGAPVAPPGQINPRSDAKGMYLLEPGQLLGFAEAKSGRRRGIALQLAVSSGTISEPALPARITAPHLAQLLGPLARGSTDGADSTIESSIDFALQSALEETLDAVSAGIVADGHPQRSAALLLDGLTGEIAAISTFPTRPEHLGPAAMLTGERRGDLAEHFALTPLAVGSTMKVPFAAAISTAYPDLLALKTECSGPAFTRVEGRPLVSLGGKPLSLGDHCRGATTRFRDFIAFSSNRYALTLLARARARLEAPDAADWRDNLYRLACLVPYSRRNDDADQGWSGKAPGCGEALWRDRRGHPVATDRGIPRTYLRLNDIDNEFVDYYQSVLGGNRSFTPLIGVAQAYARIISATAVAPRLSATIASSPPPSIEIDPEVWRQVLDGMWGAIAREGGTARNAIAPTVQAMPAMRRGFYMLAKTGTPTVEWRDIDGEVSRGDGSVLVLAAIRTRTGKPPREPEDLCSLRLAAINFQYREGGKRPPAADLVNLLAKDSPAFRAWFAAPCPSGNPS